MDMSAKCVLMVLANVPRRCEAMVVFFLKVDLARRRQLLTKFLYASQYAEINIFYSGKDHFSTLRKKTTIAITAERNVS